jgi:protein-disulfide isomerase
VGAASKGDPTAPVAIVEFVDFQCPYCGTFAKSILPELETEFISKGTVSFVLKHLPLESIHPAAKPAAVAAHCAGEAGRFWEAHDLLWREARDLRADSALDFVAELAGLDRSAYDDCVQKEGPAAVAADIELARSLGVRSTPTFFVGESTPAGLRATRRVSGAAAMDVFRDAIEKVLRGSGRDTRRALTGGQP